MERVTNMFRVTQLGSDRAGTEPRQSGSSTSLFLLCPSGELWGPSKTVEPMKSEGK